MTKFDAEVAISSIKSIDKRIADLQMVRAVLGDLVDQYLDFEQDFPQSGSAELVCKIQDVRYDVIDKQLEILNTLRDDILSNLVGISA